MNSSKITDAITQVRNSIQAMSPEELLREFNAFQTTDVYDLLFHSGHFESNVDEFEEEPHAEAVTITVQVVGTNGGMEKQNPIVFQTCKVDVQSTSFQVFHMGGLEQWAA